jgi:hypothetical protein
MLKYLKLFIKCFIFASIAMYIGILLTKIEDIDLAIIFSLSYFLALTTAIFAWTQD